MTSLCKNRVQPDDKVLICLCFCSGLPIILIRNTDYLIYTCCIYIIMYWYRCHMYISIYVYMLNTVIIIINIIVCLVQCLSQCGINYSYRNSCLPSPYESPCIKVHSDQGSLPCVFSLRENSQCERLYENPNNAASFAKCRFAFAVSKNSLQLSKNLQKYTDRPCRAVKTCRTYSQKTCLV